MSSRFARRLSTQPRCDAYRIEPGHDAWVLGDEPFIALEFESKTAETKVKA
jgi:hypothetical protein